MDRVMREYWQGNLDASGPLLGASTAYGIIQNLDDRNKFDFEQQNRFYKKQDLKQI